MNAPQTGSANRHESSFRKWLHSLIPLEARVSRPGLRPLTGTNQTERALNRHYYAAFGGCAVLLMACIFIGTATGKSGNEVARIAESFAAAFFAGGAAYFVGALTGFLFGIPRVVSSATGNKPTAKADGEAQAFNFGHNTNLEQIADWLTKIIVGLGLTQFNEIATRFDTASKAVAAAIAVPAGITPTTAYGACVLAYFGICGFFVAYLWTRRYMLAEFKAADADVEQLSRQLEETLNSASAGLVQTRTHTSSAAYREMVEGRPSPGTVPDDPWKGQFGGAASANGRLLTAKVSRVAGEADWFDVKLRVRADATAVGRLRGPVQFYLHPTFQDFVRTVSADASGVAELGLIAWGAFTVGVLADDGRTKLELDLAQLADAPGEFRTK